MTETPCSLTNQTISFTSTAPAATVGGATYTPTATGGASGNPVTFTIDATTSSVCSISGGVVSFLTVGTCTIDADQAGNTSYYDATQVQQNVTVAPGLPTVTTNAATGVNAWAAQLNGTVSSNGATTTVNFEYGLTNLYGSSITATQSPLGAGPPNPAVNVSVLLEGLNCGSTFHYRAVASNSAGLVNGADQAFTTGACTSPFPANACVATRYGGNPGCTANDVLLSNIGLAAGSPSSCVSGTPVTLNIDMTINFGSSKRYDVGIFIANDGKSPVVLPTGGGASTCTVAVLPIAPDPQAFPNLDGGITGDTCGDGSAGLSQVYTMKDVTIPCYASASSGGKLYVPYVVSWDQQASPVGGLCTSNQYPVPGGPSKCNVPGSAVPIEVVVLPKINKTHSGATFNSGDSITYSIVVFNDSGGTLQQSTLTDPAVPVGGGTPGPGTPGLVVGSIGCVAANGAICPGATIAAGGHGINPVTIPSLNLPNNSSLTFIITGNLYGAIGETISNIATITMPGGSFRDSTDSVTLGSASGGKSFAPSSITEGNNSVLTITFTNPTASDVTGVTFTDTYPPGLGLVNAASPNASTTCGGTTTPTATAGGTTLTFTGGTGGTIPALGSCTVSVTVTSATANSYINSVTFSSGGSGIAGSTTSATLIVTTAVFGSFNACNSATPNPSCTSATDPTHSRLGTKLAGTAFSLDLVALNSNGSRNTSYANTVVVQLLDASNNSGSLDAYNCRSSWTTGIFGTTGTTGTTVIATATLSPPTAVFNNGLLPVPFTVPNAYKDVRVLITQNGSSTIRGCSTDNFAIRPSAVTLWTTANAATFPSASATTKIVAGANFTLSAWTCSDGNKTCPGGNYNVTLALDSSTSKLTAQITSQDATQQSGGTVGTLTTGTTVPATNIPTLTTNPSSSPSGNATYSEVGYLYLGAGAFRDDSYTAVDQPSDCIAFDSNNPPSNTDYLSDVPINGKYGCSVGNKSMVSLGRFIPDHFGVTGTVQTRSDLLPATGSTFTYMDEPMKLTLTVKAYRYVATPSFHSADPNNDITLNYAGSFAKLDAATLCSGNVTTCATGTNGINWFNTGCTGTTQCMGLGAVNDNFAQCTANPSQTGCAAVNTTCGVTSTDPVCTKGLSNRLSIDTTSTGSGAPSNTAWNNGSSDFTAYVKFGRQISPLDGPYQKLKLGGMPRDSEGVTLPGPGSSDVHHVDLDATAGDALASNPDTINERKLLSPGFTTDVRFGRLHLLNAYGSELLPMRVDARTEYWDGTRWVLNTVDALTAIPRNGVTASGTIAGNTCFLTNPPPSAPTNANCLLTGSPVTTFSGGLGRWVVFDKTLPSVGYVDLSIGLAAMPWLKGFWTSTGTGYDDDPNARIKFGSPKAPFIYLRERY